MKCWSVAGCSAFALRVGLGTGDARAQQSAAADLPPLPRTAPRAGPRVNPTIRPRRVSYQNVPPLPSPTVPPVPAPPTTVPVPVPSGVEAVPPPPAIPESIPAPPTAGTEVPPTPSPTTPGPTATVPAAPGTGGGGGVLRSNTDLSLPRSEREGGGGEPTEAVAAKEEEKAPEKDPTKLLMNALGLEESPVKVYGWLQNSYTGNTNGVPKNGQNFGVNPNNLANSWQGNQYYLIIENPLEQGDKINFGFRVDNLFGNDWQFNHSHGFADTSAKANHFNGYDMAQAYAEVHLPPVLSKGGTDIKGGRFYTIHGYEVVPATGRPLLSVDYMFNYGQPFTHVGAIATTHVTDRVNWYNSVVNGWDRWINGNYKWNYMGGFTWTGKEGKGSLAVCYITGPEQYPRFLPGNTVVAPTGGSPIGFNPGRVNQLYGGNFRTLLTEVFTYKWSDTFTQVIESDQGHEGNVPGYGPGGTPRTAEWYSFGNWFLWQFWKTEERYIVTAVWRSEWFRDVGGIRTGTGRTDNYYEFTLGLIIKPTPYLWVRPEARYDWAQFGHPYSDGTRNSQLTLAVDAILLY